MQRTRACDGLVLELRMKGHPLSSSSALVDADALTCEAGCLAHSGGAGLGTLGKLYPPEDHLLRRAGKRFKVGSRRRVGGERGGITSCEFRR